MWERSYVPCPHCQTIHDASTWPIQNGSAFKSWFGLYCPQCGGVIPCLMNAMSYIILVLTVPFWHWLSKSLRATWLKKQPKRFKSIGTKSVKNPYKGYDRLRSGLAFGLIMFALMIFLFPFIIGEKISWKSVSIYLPSWLIAGLLFGISIKFIFQSKGGGEVVNSD